MSKTNKKCPVCGSNHIIKKGKRNRKQRFQCRDCHLYLCNNPHKKATISVKTPFLILSLSIFSNNGIKPLLSCSLALTSERLFLGTFF
ncbi:hypothetical protein CGC56_04630 [Capnocytophaga canimorsus]|uniref:Uncharacterized protein n=1 Tax=Capnocytophaga canimorsus TaxID=28188 RepID=A0A250G432_9FLAO|nr:hypothetical protein CGC56_04630 [Capnocytophaga canimorsus]